MDSQLSLMIEHDSPRLNAQLADGIATKHLNEVERYVDQVFTLTSKNFPKGLEYCGYVRCSAEEEFKQRTRRRENRCVFDIALSNVFMVKYLFKYMDKELPPTYMYLPYADDAGIIKLGGASFAIAPVLADRVISVGVSNVFIRLLRGKVTFMRNPHSIIIDNQRHSVQITYGLIYNKNDRQKKFETTIRMSSVLPHYLFCKFGIIGTFKKYCGITPVFGTIDTINTTNYPSDEYVICSSTGLKPKALGKVFYEATRIRIAIRKDQFTALAKQLVAGFFYVVDHFPGRLQLEFIHSTNIWKILLGHILISGKVHEGILHDDMDEHVKSLDEYIDIPVALSLKDIGIEIDNFYDLMIVVMDRFSDWVLEAGDNINSMYNKELSVLYYVMYEITSAIFKLYFKLKAAGNKVMNEKEVESIFKTYLKTGLIYSITKMHGEISSSSYSGDNKTFKYTTTLVPQADSNRLKSRRSHKSTDDPSKQLHVSVAEVGGYSHIPKSDPSGRSRLNLFAGIDKKNVIKRDKELIEFLDNIQSMIK